MLQLLSLRYFSFTNYFTLKVTFLVGISMSIHFMILPLGLRFQIVSYDKNIFFTGLSAFFLVVVGRGFFVLFVCLFVFQSSQNNIPQIYMKILCFSSLKFKYLVFIFKCLQGFIQFVSLSRINVVQFSLT